jgi:hypothetical protein
MAAKTRQKCHQGRRFDKSAAERVVDGDGGLAGDHFEEGLRVGGEGGEHVVGGL